MTGLKDYFIMDKDELKELFNSVHKRFTVADNILKSRSFPKDRRIGVNYSYWDQKLRIKRVFVYK